MNKFKFIFLLALLVSVWGAVILVRYPNYVAPYIYTYFSKLSFSQEEARYVEKGLELAHYKVGAIPTSIDISQQNENNHSLALVTSMGDSTLSIVDLLSKSEESMASYAFTSGAKPRVSIWCDIDKDGLDEIVVPMWGDGYSSVFVGKLTSDMEVEKIGEYVVGYRPRSVACGDLDGDGFNEIVTADNYSNTLSIIDNDGSLFYYKSISVGDEPGAVTIVDFDGDGSNDLLVSHRSSNNIFILIQRGRFEFDHALTLPTLEAPKDQVVVDIDSDGFLDVISADGTSNNISIYYIKNMKVDRVERVKVSGSPHALKYIERDSGPGLIVVASYPNWIEVITQCDKKFQLNESLWFGGKLGILKRKILYLDSIPGDDYIYAVMAGLDSVVKLPIRFTKCD